MNIKNKKVLVQEVKETMPKILLQKIILKAYEITKNTKHDVFVNFSGHVNWLDVTIYINGWKEIEDPDIKKRAILDSKKAIKQLTEIIKELQEL